MFKGSAVVDRFGMRKLVILSIVILGLVAPSAANATISTVFGTVTCTTQGAGASEGQRWCGNTAGTTVPSWDGTPIDVSVAFPPATGEDNNYPVIGIYHGWGSTKILPSSAQAQRWLKLGYAVFSQTDRGWGNSCKASEKTKPECANGYVHLMSRAYEVHDAQYLLGLLADEGVINPQEIGATGESYGGGMSEQLGSLKDRVQLTDGELVPWLSPGGKPMKIAATAPEWPWTDLAQALQPNGSNLDYVANAPYSGMLGNHEYGVQKRNWNEDLYLDGELLGAYYQTAPGEPEANITEWYNFNNTGGPYNGKPLAIQQEQQLPNHGAYYTSLSDEPAPALLQNGWNDDLFPVSESVDYYNKVRASYPNAAIQLFGLDYGHNPRSATSPSASEVALLNTAQNEWFEYYVRGQGSEPANAHGGVTAITSACTGSSTTTGTEYTASNWASLAPGEINLQGAAEQTIAAPGTAPKTAFTSGTVCTPEAAGENASAATYKLAAAPAAGFTIAGSPTVVAEFSTPIQNDQVIARLMDVEPAGNQRLIGRAIYRPTNPEGGFVKQVFQLHPQAWKVESGHVLKLQLVVQDSTYARTSSSTSTSAASIKVRNLELRLPTIEKPGSDEGLVQTPLPKYLPPGYSLARNVPTTTPGVPYLSSGTNPNTGVFTLAWEASAPAAGLTYTLQHKPASGGSFSTVATGLTSPEYAFTSGNKEEEGDWVYRVSASNESAESEYSGASAAIKVDRSAPVVVTEPATSITQTSATLNATVNPKDQTVSECEFEYGTSEAYGTSVPCSSLPGSGESPVMVSAPVTGLVANTTYHFRIVATNVNGTSQGSDQMFTTLPNPPAVVTEAASPLTQTTATLNATVNPEGSNVTNCHFEYGTTPAYGLSAPCASLPGSGTSPVAVSASVGSLTASTTYHFRIVATNASGTSKGSDETFTTLPNPPTVVTGAATSVTRTMATLNATVNPEDGLVSDCHFEYGTSEASGTSVPCSALPGSGESPVAVSASVTGLTANTTYYFRIVATNPGGTSSGAEQTFKTLPSGGAPHWYKDGVQVKQGTVVPTLSWGTLTLASEEGAVTCRTSALGAVENPAGGPAGLGETDSFNSADCVLSSGECKASEGLEVMVTPEEMPWGSELEEGTFNGKPVVRQRTKAELPGTSGFASGLSFLSTEGAQLTSRCVFRGAQPAVKQMAETLCGRAFPGTSKATLYNPATRTVESIEAIGFEVYVIEAATSCSGTGQLVEEAEVARRPSTPGDPARYDVPGAPVVQCEGESAPHMKNGTSAAKPSEVLFDQNGHNGGEAENDTTGTLTCGEAGAGTTTGTLQTEGFGSVETLTTK